MRVTVSFRALDVLLNELNAGCCAALSDLHGFYKLLTGRRLFEAKSYLISTITTHHKFGTLEKSIELYKYLLRTVAPRTVPTQKSESSPKFGRRVVYSTCNTVPPEYLPVHT